MAKRGRKPKPTVLKFMAGTLRPGRINQAEPKLPPGVPEPPPFLNSLALVKWVELVDEMVRSGVLTKFDGPALGAFCQSYSDVIVATFTHQDAARNDPEFHGLLARSSTGSLVQHPLLFAIRRARQDMVRYAAELGLTPSARSRVQAIPPEDAANEPGARFFAGKRA